MMIAMETGARGFLITGKDSFLEPFNKAQQVWQEKNKAL
ncbi:CHASE3 domain-containing protein [Colwellia sp. MT41]|nr:CHASE3 domain-containing protein [Colwellia sp. MT41]